ncbi:hypothetical protein [Natrialbaceae archaeon AArc-T1-2]|uniref:hypothetical protein n=1 Tax=Natrialbaceae archaeon AArc-T1-2 TaxID=3053904 RepID=UPI00255AEFE1|nr:hypothetical protein [Natrialbaceae archaeon AArc-T1-2]WIV68332.1 hypothetical protein QQ977_06310 [Natrialbaceae archaeon AArc-T1-2]
MMSPQTNGRKITAYLVSIFTIVFGTVYVFASAIGFGVPIIAAGTIANPWIRDVVRTYLGIHVPAVAVALLYVLGWIVALWLSPPPDVSLFLPFHSQPTH